MGEILGAHGVKGVLRIRSFAAVPADVAAYGPLEDESGRRRFALTVVGQARGAVLAAAEGVADRDQAATLRGVKLYLPRAALPPLDAGEYYWDDLIGLRAELADGTVLGKIVAVHDYGAGASLEIAREGRGAVVVPFTHKIVPLVDAAAGRLVVDPPKGLLDSRPVEIGHGEADEN